MTKKYIIAFETSCDETAISIIDINGNIIGENVFSQIDIHKQYGGVVPEVASRNHSVKIQQMTTDFCQQYNIKSDEIAATAATCGPGLIGAIIVGMMFAKGIAHSLSIPFIPVNHLEGHILSATIEDKSFDYPFLALLISGGHCFFAIAHSLGKYEILGQTLDDAAGEAFDKTARMLNLPYPGGKDIDHLAQKGDRNRFPIPLTMVGRKTVDMSFSGLKTSALRKIQAESELDDQKIADFAASIQWSITAILENSLKMAIDIYTNNYCHYPRHLIVCGGVAANSQIRNMLQNIVIENGFSLSIPSLKYCTDNATMIAVAAWRHFINQNSNFKDTLSFAPRAHWPLSNN